MTEPPFPDQLLGQEWAVVRGYSRRLNKRSSSRGCKESAAAYPPQNVPSAYTIESRRVSLAFGTCPGGEMTGQVLTYPSAMTDTLLHTLDQREGWWPDRGLAACGYVRDTVLANVAGEEIEAVTYLSNPAGEFHAPEISLKLTASILLHATPFERGHRACGAFYVEDVHHCLQDEGTLDPYLEHVLRAVREQQEHLHLDR